MLGLRLLPVMILLDDLRQNAIDSIPLRKRLAIAIATVNPTSSSLLTRNLGW